MPGSLLAELQSRRLVVRGVANQAEDGLLCRRELARVYAVDGRFEIVQVREPLAWVLLLPGSFARGELAQLHNRPRDAIGARRLAATQADVAEHDAAVVVDVDRADDV